MVRFFAARSDISGGTIKLSAEDAAHIRSLRLSPSEFFVVCDGEGMDYVCRLSGAGERAVAEIVETRPSSGEPTVKCSVYIALMKGDRLDYAVQKSVELGAHEIVLFPSERCISLPGDMSKKTARLQRISLETAKQCGRGRVPGVTAGDTFETAVGKAARADVPLFFYECEENLHLKQALCDAERRNAECRMQNAESEPERRTPLSTLHSPPSFSLMTGPEGGFEPHEAELARSAGMLSVTLGSRIMRCETAPVAALAAIMFQTENF